jgi:hypothetical protein
LLRLTIEFINFWIERPIDYMVVVDDYIHGEQVGSEVADGWYWIL